MIPQVYSPAELARVKDYVRPLYWGIPLGFLFDALQLAVLFWLCRPIYERCQRAADALSRRLAGARRVPVVRALPAALDRLWSGPGWGAALLFAIVTYLFVELTRFPKDLYFGFIHEKAFGLSRQTLGRFLYDDLKGFLIIGSAIGLLAFGVFGLIRKTRHWWWALGVFAGVAMILSSAVDPYRARLYYQQTPLPTGPLRARITALMAKAHVDFRDVVVEKTAKDTPRVQAYFAGTGPTRTIVLTDSILAAMSPAELAAVVGHEAGHVHENRWPNRIAASLAMVAFLFVIDRVFRFAAARRWFGVSDRADIRLLPLVSAVFIVTTIVSSPIASALSRQREEAADRYSLALTQDPAAFRQMLVKAARINKMDPQPPRWVVLFAFSHPPLAERLAEVDRFTAEKTTGEVGRP